MPKPRLKPDWSHLAADLKDRLDCGVPLDNDEIEILKGYGAKIFPDTFWLVSRKSDATYRLIARLGTQILLAKSDSDQSENGCYRFLRPSGYMIIDGYRTFRGAQEAGRRLRESRDREKRVNARACRRICLVIRELQRRLDDSRRSSSAVIALDRMFADLNLPGAPKRNRINVHEDGNYMPILHSSIAPFQYKNKYALLSAAPWIGPCQTKVSSPLLFGRIAKDGLIVGRFGGVRSVTFDEIIEPYIDVDSGNVMAMSLKCEATISVSGSQWVAHHYAGFRSTAHILSWLASNDARMRKILKFDYVMAANMRGDQEKIDIIAIEEELKRWKNKCLIRDCSCARSLN